MKKPTFMSVFYCQKASIPFTYSFQDKTIIISIFLAIYAVITGSSLGKSKI